MGLFGESTDELIKKEIEAKRKYAANHGVKVNASINDMKLADNVFQNNKMNVKDFRKVSYIFAIIISVIIITAAINYISKPKPDYEGFNSVMNESLSKIDNIVKYEASGVNNSIYRVTIKGNTWFGSDLDKVSYCDSIRKAFTAYGWDYNIIDKNDTMYVIFLNEDGITLAEPDGNGFGKYKIYY
jgi:hypothetical protein